eukprot:m.92555 g.92555  ORF g.92555 m.92555 type:complete len:296 (+) comp13358_c0_seq2:320-1207(+)
MLLFVASTLCLSHAPPGFTGPSQLDLSKWRNKRVMAIAAHPDDIEYFVGGTLLSLQEQQLNISLGMLIVTNGNAGGTCYNATGYQPPSYECEPEEIAYLRRQEMKAGAKALGAKKLWRCGFNDGMLISYHEEAVRSRISAYIRAFQPDIVLTHYPYPNFEAPQTCNGECPGVGWDDLGFHPDHKRVGLHVLNACYGSGGSASNNLLFADLYEAAGLEKWQPSELYFFALTKSQPITHFTALSNQTMMAKAAALLNHKSQYTTSPLPSISWVASQVAKEANVSDKYQFVEGLQAFF